MARAAGDGVPPGYTRLAAGGAEVVALDACVEPVRRALDAGTLYAYAATHPARRALRGRAIAFAVPLPDGATHVVVRHSRHGGLLARLTGDLFLPPTRAPRELDNALRLSAAGVATPELVAYAVYRASALLRRADVATREVKQSRDLAEVLADRDDAARRTDALRATAELLVALERAGAHHPDLNLKNVLITRGDGTPARAAVLDVDRVEFGEGGDRGIGRANFERLARSARKLRARGAIAVSDAELAALAASAGHPSPGRDAPTAAQVSR